ncbi:unnamed protein product [Effrenium voratum]|nr:unnamed protein product [Effrenium voratum]
MWKACGRHVEGMWKGSKLETTSTFQGFGNTKLCARRVAAVLLFWFETVVSDYLRQLRKRSRIPCPATQMKSTLLQGIKNKEELSIAASKIDIYSKKDGRWVKEARMSASLHDTDEADCYGFVLPA